MGQNNLDVATTKLALAFLYQYRGEYDLAEPLYQESLDTRKQLLGDDYFDIVESISAIGFLEQTKGDYERALSYFLNAFNMSKRLASGDNEYVAETMKNLGGIYRILGRSDEAEAILRNALTIQKRLYNDGPHPKIDNTKRELAGLLRNSRRFEEAKSLYKEVIDSRTKILGPDHVEVAHVWNSYSQLLSDMDESDAAIAANKIFIEIMLRAYSGPHPSLGAAYNNRATLLKNNGQLEEAIEQFQLSINMQDAVGLAKRHVNRSFPLGGLGLVYLE